MARVVGTVERPTVAAVRRSPNGLHAFALVLRYMFHAVHDLDPGEVRALVEGAADPEVAEEIVSLAEKLLEQGRQEGVQKGRAETVLKQLQLKFGKVSAAIAARVRAASEPELERWTERVLTAPSLAEVLNG